MSSTVSSVPFEKMTYTRLKTPKHLKDDRLRMVRKSAFQFSCCHLASTILSRLSRAFAIGNRIRVVPQLRSSFTMHIAAASSCVAAGLAKRHRCAFPFARSLGIDSPRDPAPENNIKNTDWRRHVEQRSAIGDIPNRAINYAAAERNGRRPARPCDAALTCGLLCKSLSANLRLTSRRLPISACDHLLARSPSLSWTSCLYRASVRHPCPWISSLRREVPSLRDPCNAPQTGPEVW